MPLSGAAQEIWTRSGSDSGPTAPGKNTASSGGERSSKHRLLRLGMIPRLAALDLLFGQANFSAQFSHGIVTPACFVPESIALSAAILFGPWV